MSSGMFTWLRPGDKRDQKRESTSSGPVRNTPIVLVGRANIKDWQHTLFDIRDSVDAAEQGASVRMSGKADRLFVAMTNRGASFFSDLVAESGLLRSFGLDFEEGPWLNNGGQHVQLVYAHID